MLREGARPPEVPSPLPPGKRKAHLSTRSQQSDNCENDGARAPLVGMQLALGQEKLEHTSRDQTPSRLSVVELLDVRADHMHKPRRNTRDVLWVPAPSLIVDQEFNHM